MQQKFAQPDFGTGQKKIGIYTFGVVACALLTLLAFWVVMHKAFSPVVIVAIILSAASVQFVIQLICFLRLNVETTQGKSNVMSFIFTCVVLTTILSGSLWIMANLNYLMMGDMAPDASMPAGMSMPTSMPREAGTPAHPGMPANMVHH